MRPTVLIVILMTFVLSACMDSPVTEGDYNVPEKDFESYQKESEMLRNSNNSSN